MNWTRQHSVWWPVVIQSKTQSLLAREAGLVQYAHTLQEALPGGATEYSSQGVQETFPLTAKVPLGHSAHVSPSGTEPSWQKKHAELCSRAYMPAAQLVQSRSPVTENVPWGHPRQNPWPADGTEPFGQRLHWALPSGAKDAKGQAVQFDDPASSPAYLPAGQGLHSRASSEGLYPCGHGVQGRPANGDTAPEGHGKHVIIAPTTALSSPFCSKPAEQTSQSAEPS